MKGKREGTGVERVVGQAQVAGRDDQRQKRTACGWSSRVYRAHWKG